MFPIFAPMARLFRQPTRLADGTLWLLAATHLVVAVSFLLVLLSVMPASAQGSSCGGRDLLTELRQDKSERYKELVAEAAAVPNGKGLLWKIEKDGIGPSYLLGTMHVTDPRVVVMPPAARKAAAAASTVVIESDEILDEKKATSALLMRPELSMFTDGSTISDHLTPEDAEKLKTGLKARGLSLAAVSRMKPWIIASFVALPACEISRKAAGASFLDKKIAEDAVAAGKSLVGLETLAEQLEAMASLPVDFHMQALIETLALGDRMSDVMETLTLLYLAGDTGMAMPMLKAVTEDLSVAPDAGYVEFEKRIITDRNKTMAERSAAILSKGNAFVAVGALHLPGQEGLVELLRTQGFTLTAIDG